MRLREILEREKLLSRNMANPTVGRLRDRKEKCSTRKGLRVDSGIWSFFKLLEVGFSPYLGFIPITKCFTNVSVVWGREGPFDRSQNLGPNL